MHRVLPIVTTSTRSRHNPGDTFIGLGCQHLVEHAADTTDVPWQIVSRFRQVEWECYRSDIERAGLAIYGGMPQYNNYSKWCLHYDLDLWRDVLNPSGARVIIMGGGSGEPNPRKTPDEWADELSSDAYTVEVITERTKSAACFIVRDRHAATLLDRLGIASTLLPCPAIFAARHYNIQRNPVEARVAIVTQQISPNDGGRAAKAMAYARLRREVFAAGYEPVIVCHEENEYHQFRDSIPAGDIFYTNDYRALLRFYGTCEGVISARLHGSMVAWGAGVERGVGITIDSRGHALDEIGMPHVLIEEDGSIDTRKIIEAFTSDAAYISTEDRARRMAASEARHRDIIGPILQEWMNPAIDTTEDDE